MKLHIESSIVDRSYGSPQLHFMTIENFVNTSIHNSYSSLQLTLKSGVFVFIFESSKSYKTLYL